MVQAKSCEGWNIPFWNNMFGMKMTIVCGAANCGAMFEGCVADIIVLEDVLSKEK